MGATTVAAAAPNCVLASEAMTSHVNRSDPNDRRREAGSRSSARVASANGQPVAPIARPAINCRPVGLSWSFVRVLGRDGTLFLRPLNIPRQFVVGSPETGRCSRFHSLSRSSCAALPALMSVRASSASLPRAS